MKGHLLAILCCLFFVSCGVNNKGNTVKREDVIVVGTNAAYPPFESINSNGSIEGFDIDLVEEIGVRLGKKIEIVDTSFDSLILSLKAKKIDLILSGMSITKDRLKEIAMVPYHGQGVKSISLMFWNDIPENPLVLQKYKHIAVQTGTFQETILLSYGNLNIKSLEHTLDIISEIKYGKSDVAVLEPGIGNFLLKSFPQLKCVCLHLEEKDRSLGLGIGMNIDRQDLIDSVTDAIFNIKADGTMAKLLAHWSLTEEEQSCCLD